MGNFKMGAKLFGSLIIAVLISFFICMSISALSQILFTKTEGYTAYVYTEESDDPVDHWEYTFTDPDGDGVDNGTDDKKAHYDKLEEYEVKTYTRQSNLEGIGMAVNLVVSQILCGILVISFASSATYKRGFKDSNLVRIGNIKQDKLKGFKVGLIANIPFFVLFVLFVACGLGLAPSLRVTLYGYLNSFIYPIIYLITGCSSDIIVSELNVLQYILLFLVQFIVPIICGVAYLIGFKEINLSEKIMYKKKGDK